MTAYRYVSIAQGKAQLNAPQLEDEAIEQKIQLASGVIRDYLKERWADQRSVIASSSVANPTVITTATAHGYVNGDEVTISGHVDSTPALDGTYTLSNVTLDSFTIPVNVTVAGTGGVAVVAWTEETAPWPVQAATLLMLTHLHEHRGDDMSGFEALEKAVRWHLDRSRDPALA